MELKLNESVSRQLLSRLERLPSDYAQVVKTTIMRAGNDVRNSAIKDAPYKTGNLWRSITLDVSPEKAVIGTNLVYAKIHDQGGTIPAHTVIPKKAKVLQFFINGRPVFARKANMPARKVQPYRGKGYLTPAYQNMRDGKFAQIFNQEINRILK